MTLYEHLLSYADTQPDKTAIESSTGHLSYSQLLQLIEQCADYFASLDLTSGDRVAILALNHADWFVALFAAAKTGIVLVPMNWRLSSDELDYVIVDCKPKLLLHDQEFANTALALNTNHPDMVLCEIGLNSFPPQASIRKSEPQQPAIKDPLLIVYTSGTTGRPKGAVLSQNALLCSAEMSCHMLELVSNDRVLNVLPLFHVGGLNIQPLPSLLAGATLVLPLRFDPHDTVKALREQQITLMTVVPTVLQAMLTSPDWEPSKISALRAMSIGSTDVPVALIKQVQKFDIPVLQIYGATETGPAAIYQRAEDAHKVGTIGRAGLLCEIKLINESGTEVQVGESGEICVKGENILTSYWNNAAASKESIVGGWFRTGDVAHIDGDGYYWFDDRLKHVVISGGENIYPAELERIIREVPGVEELSVVGKADERWGEIPVAVIVGTADKLAVLDACKQLAKFKQPRDVVFVDELLQMVWSN